MPSTTRFKLGGKIVWMPTLSAANHINVQNSGGAKNFPKTSKKMLDPIPLSALDANGKLTDDTKKVIDLIAEADIILAGGHLHVSEQHVLFEEAARRGVKKMLVNHPTYVVGFNDSDIRQLVGLGVVMEHSICMFIKGKSEKFSANDLAHLIEVAGVDNTILSSDLGLLGSQRPVDGFPQYYADAAGSADAARRHQETDQRKCGGVFGSAGKTHGRPERRLKKEPERLLQVKRPPNGPGMKHEFRGIAARRCVDEPHTMSRMQRSRSTVTKGEVKDLPPLMKAIRIARPGGPEVPSAG